MIQWMLKTSLTILAVTSASFLFSIVALAFPENVRYGYASCNSCHLSPTGGGVLTNYGRKASGDFLSTWAKDGENDFAWGAVSLPDWLALGGDVRHLSYKRELDGKVFERRLLMQQEAEAAVKFTGNVWLDISHGTYDGSEQTQRAWILWAPTDNFYTRTGKFFVPFGILRPDHSAISRRAVGMDQGMETINFEVGWQNERGELVFTGIMGDWRTGSETFDPYAKDKGFNMRAASYFGGNSQMGVSLLAVTGEYLDRQASSLFAMTGWSEKYWYLGELIFEKRRLAGTDAPFNSAIVNHHQLGWEFFKGAHMILNAELQTPVGSALHKNQWTVGPGLQWFPRPHFEFTVQANRIFREQSRDFLGSELKMVSHLWL
jgi:hypothetical protein